MQEQPKEWPVLQPYRSIGELTTGSITMQTAPTVCFVAPTNHSYKIYNTKLVLQNISPHFASEVRAVISDGDRVYARLAGQVVNMHYYHIVKSWQLKDPQQLTTTILRKVGDAVLVSEASTISVINVRDGELCQMDVGFEVLSLVHPETYVNKVVVGGAKTLELWNFNSRRRIFSFQEVLFKGREHELDLAITAVETSPVIDVLAVALNNGVIAMLNLRTAQIIFELKQKTAVTAMSFSRTGRPILATGNSKGSIIFWQLQEKRILGKLSHAHLGPITSMLFVPDEPMVLSASPADNCLKQWCYDEVEKEHFRMLRQRVGLSSPIEWFEVQNDQEVVVYGPNETLSTSLLAENRCYLLPKCLASRLPVHLSSIGSTINVFNKQTITKTMDVREVPISGAVSLSGKQWFVLTATRVIRITISSVTEYTLPEGFKPLSLCLYQQHFVFVLSPNSIEVLDFDKLLLMHRLQTNNAVVMAKNHQDTFLAVAGTEGIDIWDMRRARKGRQFLFGESLRPLWVSFSADNRFVLCSFSDLSLRIYSLVESRLYKTITTESPLRCHGMTPDNNLFLSCFEGNREINIWYNQIGQVTTASDVSLLHFETEVKVADTTNMRAYLHSKDAPSTQSAETTPFKVEEYLDQLPDAEDDPVSTFTQLPLSRWMPLLHYDEIKQRNTVKVNIEKKYEAPFFLDFKNKSEVAKKHLEDYKKEIAASSRVLKDNQEKLLANPKNRLDLSEEPTEEEYQRVFERIKNLTPAEVDLELRNCLLIPGNTAPLITMFTSLLQTPTEIDVKLVYLSRLMQLLGEDLLQEDVKACMQQLKPVLHRIWSPIQWRLDTLLAVCQRMSNR